MERKPTILVTGLMSRPDLLSMFDALLGAAELVFVEYAAEWGAGVVADAYARYGALHTWEAAGSARLLLGAVRPDLIAFLSCTSYNQVALRASARRQGIRCVHVEHGLRRAPSSSPLLGASPTAPETRFSSWRTHAFLARSIVEGGRAALPLIRYTGATWVRGGSHDVLRRHAPMRQLDHYISFSPECFAYHRHVDRLGTGAEVTYVGVPQFDVYADRHGRDVDENAAILVDHQMVNAGFLGWDTTFRDRWAAALADTVGKAGLTLHVKEHPGDRTRTWQRLGASNVRVLEGSELPELAQRARVVLGLASTLQLPLAALRHVAHIALEIHPMPGLAFAEALVTAGVAEPVSDFAELSAVLARRREIAAAQQPWKASFERRFLFRLDGKSSQRFRAAILNQAQGGSRGGAANGDSWILPATADASDQR